MDIALCDITCITGVISTLQRLHLAVMIPLYVTILRFPVISHRCIKPEVYMPFWGGRRLIGLIYMGGSNGLACVLPYGFSDSCTVFICALGPARLVVKDKVVAHSRGFLWFYAPV